MRYDPTSTVTDPPPHTGAPPAAGARKDDGAGRDHPGARSLSLSHTHTHTCELSLSPSLLSVAVLESFQVISFSGLPPLMEQAEIIQAPAPSTLNPDTLNPEL